MESSREKACLLDVQAVDQGAFHDGEREAVDGDSGQDASLALLHAVRNGDIALSQSLLTRGASTERRNHDFRTPLHIAAERRHAAMVHLLCRFGANVNATRESGQTALHDAVARNVTDIVACLLDHSTSLNAIDDHGATPLDFALSTRHFAALKLLVASARKPTAVGNESEMERPSSFNWVWRACSTGDADFVRQLIEALDEISAADLKHALVNKLTPVNRTPLHAAANRGDLPLVALLVAHGADLETKADHEFSALYAAVQKSHDLVVQHLLLSGASADTSDSGGCSPLMVACADGFGSIVDCF